MTEQERQELIATIAYWLGYQPVIIDGVNYGWSDGKGKAEHGASWDPSEHWQFCEPVFDKLEAGKYRWSMSHTPYEGCHLMIGGHNGIFSEAEAGTRPLAVCLAIRKLAEKEAEVQA